MEPFQNFESKATPFPYVNVDTDQIIPKQFLKLGSKFGSVMLIQYVEYKMFIMNN